MRIKELTAYHVRIPLKKTIRHASHTRRVNDTLIVRCRLDDGTEGWGEGLPRSYVTGETIETALEQFRAANFDALVGEAFEDVDSVIQLCRGLTFSAPGKNRRDCFGNSVRCAVELSILDAATRALNHPFSVVTEAIAETAAIREQREWVQYSGAITAMPTWRVLVRGGLVRLYGFRQCKVKVGVAGVDDGESLRRIRRVVGPHIDLRVDANEAWSCENLEAKLERLLPSQITSVEQPVPHEQVDGLAAVRPRISTPIMLDESLCSLTDAHRAIEHGLCDLFNIRLSKCGGFVNSLKLAALAHQAGLGYQLGCQVGETGILSAAGRHFAASVANIRYLEGSYERFLVRERLTVEDLTFGRGGWAPMLTGPGLGVNVDDAALNRVTIKRECRKIQ